MDRRIKAIFSDRFARCFAEGADGRCGIGEGVCPCAVVEIERVPVFVIQPCIEIFARAQLVVDDRRVIRAFPICIRGQNALAVDLQHQNELRIVAPRGDVVIPRCCKRLVVPAVAALDGKDVVTLTKLFCDIVSVVPQRFAVVRARCCEQIVRDRCAVQIIIANAESADVQGRRFDGVCHGEPAAEQRCGTVGFRVVFARGFDEVDK